MREVSRRYALTSLIGTAVAGACAVTLLSAAPAQADDQVPAATGASSEVAVQESTDPNPGVLADDPVDPVDGPEGSDPGVTPSPDPTPPITPPTPEPVDKPAAKPVKKPAKKPVKKLVKRPAKKKTTVTVRGVTVAKLQANPRKGWRSKYILGGNRRLQPDALRVGQYAAAKFGIRTVGGVRADSLPDHPSGRAVDLMIDGYRSRAGNWRGDAAAKFFMVHARSFGIKYIIWQQRIWNAQFERVKPLWAWRKMSNRGSATANHYDHVHVTVWGNTAPARKAPRAVWARLARLG